MSDLSDFQRKVYEPEKNALHAKIRELRAQDAGLNEVFVTVLDWLKGERQTHQPQKFGEIHGTIEAGDDERTRENPDDWIRRVDMYLDRARVLGLDNPLGRQAVAKAAATAVGYFESVLRVYGDVPVFGSPSGEVNGVMKMGGHQDG